MGDGTPAERSKDHITQTWGKGRDCHKQHRDKGLQLGHVFALIAVANDRQRKDGQGGRGTAKQRAGRQQDGKVSHESTKQIDQGEQAHANQQNRLPPKPVGDRPRDERKQAGADQEGADD